MNQTIFAVFLDIDGTLTWNSPITSERNAAIFRRAQEAGHLICLNSGRSRGNIGADLVEQLKPDGIVAGGGAYVSLHGEVLLQEEIPAALVKEICTAFLKAELCCVVESETDSAIVCPERYPMFEGVPVRSAADAADFAESHRSTKLTVMALENEIPDSIKELLAPHFKTVYHPNYSEMILKQCDKARGMQVLLDAAGVDRAHSIAVGDSLNDEEMLRYAGISVAMGNAPDAVKEMADAVTAPVLEDGAGKAVERFVLTC